ncbi:hypothetical protein [Candidatus Deferrimicrobium sp.]
MAANRSKRMVIGGVAACILVVEYLVISKAEIVARKDYFARKRS